MTARTAPHVLQTLEWGELKQRFGWQAETVQATVPAAGGAGGADGAEPGGASSALVLFRPLPLGLGTFAYIPRGPAARWDDPPALRALQAAIDAACRRRRAAVLKVEPWLPDEPGCAAALAGLGYRPSSHTVQARRTILVDLTPPEDEQLAAMKSKTRYNVRLAARKGVAVREAGRADLPAFHELMAATARRDQFAVHTPAYYEAAYELLVERAGLAALLLAEHEGRPLAALFATALGPLATYLYGASADEGRQLMSTYLLQWEAMRWARARGCRDYDLLGVPDEDEATLEAQFEQRSDGLWGVYRFKRGFGGRLWRTVGAWDRVYNPAVDAMYRLYLRWRKREGAEGM